jgi:archaellum component FlaC
MTTPQSPDELRAELEALDQQIAEMQGIADDARRDLEETSDKTAAIEGAEQQEALISQLQLRRRDLMDRIDKA